MAAGRRRRIGAPLSRRGYLITSVTTFAVLLAIWTLVTVSGLVPPIFLPSPGAVLTALGEQLQNGELAAEDIPVRLARYGLMQPLALRQPLPDKQGIDAF